MNKKILSLFLLYLFQGIVSSCIPCDCPSAKTYNRTFSGFDLKTWDTSGFQDVEVTNDSVYKNSFGLTLMVNFDLHQISFERSKVNTLGSFGFMAVYACSCVEDEYINVDPISSIVISVTDTQNQEVSDVTAHFITYDYNSQKSAVSSFFENKVNDYISWHNRFELDLTAYNSIPDSSMFTVKLILKSGKELIRQTQQINFK